MGNANNTTMLAYTVNGYAKHARIDFDSEGNFSLDGKAFHRSQLLTEEQFGGSIGLRLSEHDYWHAGGDQCDTRGCVCNGGGE